MAASDNCVLCSFMIDLGRDKDHERYQYYSIVLEDTASIDSDASAIDRRNVHALEVQVQTHHRIHHHQQILNLSCAQHTIEHTR